MNKKYSFKNIFQTFTDSKSIKWIFDASKKQRFAIFVMALLNIMQAVMAVIISYMLRYVVNAATDSTLTADQKFEGVTFWGIMFVIVMLLQIVITILSRHIVFRVNARLTIDMKSRLYHKILRKDYSQVTRFHTGEMLNRLNNDVGSIVSAITGLIPSLSYVFAKLVGIFIVLFSIDPLFTLAFIGVGLFVLLVSSFFKKMMKNYHKQIMETDGKIRSVGFLYCF